MEPKCKYKYHYFGFTQDFYFHVLYEIVSTNFVIQLTLPLQRAKLSQCKLEQFELFDRRKTNRKKLHCWSQEAVISVHKIVTGQLSRAVSMSPTSAFYYCRFNEMQPQFSLSESRKHFSACLSKQTVLRMKSVRYSV